MAYRLYMDKVLLPVAPEKITLKTANQNKTVSLMDGSVINILKAPGLSEFSFELLIPQVKYDFAQYVGGFKKAAYFLALFERLKVSKKPFLLVVTRATPDKKRLFDTNMRVSLEDYSVEENEKEGFDLTVNIKLKQWREYGVKTIVLKKKASGKTTASASKSRSTASAPKKKTHTVKKGDTLWGIAKKYLGDGGRYKEIYNLNKGKIKNPNVIQVGQVLTLPS